MNDRDKIVVIGDYNLPHLQWRYDDDVGQLLPINASTDQELVLVEQLVASGLQQLNTLTNFNERILDLAFTNDADCFELLEPPLPLLRIDEHHKPFVLTFHSVVNRIPEICNGEFDFNRCNFPELSRVFDGIDWSQQLSSLSSNDATLRLYSLLNETLQNKVPKKSTSRFRRRLPWWNAQLQNLRNRLRKARKQYFRSKTLAAKLKVREMEEEYDLLRSTSFTEYIRRTQSDLQHKPQSFWSYVNRLKQTEGVPQTVNYNGHTAQTPGEIADLFSTFFRSVLSNEEPPLSEPYLNSLPQINAFIPLLSFTTNDVLVKLQTLDVSKGAGPDCLPPILFKNCAEALAGPLSIIFNKSLVEGVFPDCWKIATIVPIHKSGSVHDVKNYRAISLLSCLPKVFEALILDALHPFVQHYVSEEQHGFMRKRSTTTNMMTYVTALVGSIEKRAQVDAVYVDFSKAFDRVPHMLLIEKLKRSGFPSWLTQWIQSYLCNRSAAVRIGGTMSYPFGICSGVPQGSHLGPLLFLLFVNDLCGLLKSPKLMFADDLKFFRTITSTVDCDELQEDICRLLGWCRTNGMEVNISKCHVISFTRQRNPVLFNYSMSSSDLTRVQTVKDLGLTLDSKLTFSEHISSCTAKAFAVLGFIKRNTQQFGNIYCLKALYCSLVRSILEYGVQVWAPHQVTHINRIERVQKAFIRYALRSLPFRNPTELPPYEHRCQLISLPTLQSRRQVLQRLFIFDVIQNNIDCTALLSQLRFNVPPRHTRSTNFFRTALHRTQYGQFSPLETCCRRFNEVYELFDFNISKSVFRLRLIGAPLSVQQF